MSGMIYLYLLAFIKVVSCIGECQCNRSDLAALENKIERLERYMLDMHKALEEKDDQLSRRLLLPGDGNTPKSISFSAYLSHEFAGPAFGNLREIVFDAIETNNGNGYDEYSGTFRAPLDGVYAFTWTIFVEGRANNLGEIVTELIINGAIHGVTHADTETISDDDSCTGFLIKNLSAGDTVFIRTNKSFRPQGIMMSNSKNKARWTFSGWLIS